MSFFEFDDVKRLHVGYQDPIYKCKYTSKVITTIH